MRFFTGFDRIADDIRVLFSQSTQNITAKYEPDESALLITFSLLVTFRKESYPVPMRIKFFPGYPTDGPLYSLYTLNERQHFKQPHNCVTPDGGISVALLMDWSSSNQIQHVIQQIREEFEKDFPIREVRVNKPQQVAPPPPPPPPPPPANPTLPPIPSNPLEDQAMRSELVVRINDARAIMFDRINRESRDLRVLNNDLYQRVNIVDRTRAEKTAELQELCRAVYDMEQRCSGVQKFLDEHPAERIAPQTVGSLATPKDPLLVQMMDLKAQIDAFDYIASKLEKVEMGGNANDAMNLFFEQAQENFKNIYRLQIMLNQYPEYRQYFVGK